MNTDTTNTATDMGGSGEKVKIPDAPRQGMLSLAIKDKGSLYAAYMPFVKGGGLFIPTNKSYKMGDEVFILLTLMDENSKMPVMGQVIWLNPAGGQSNSIPGIGIQFIDKDGAAVRNKIETYLAGTLTSDRMTHTM